MFQFVRLRSSFVISYDLLPITPQMEWVPTSHGQIPAGHRPVDGGFEASGERLYHAVGVISGVSVPGKTAAHLGMYNLLLEPHPSKKDIISLRTAPHFANAGGAHLPFGNAENILREDYWILYV